MYDTLFIFAFFICLLLFYPVKLPTFCPYFSFKKKHFVQILLIIWQYCLPQKKILTLIGSCKNKKKILFFHYRHKIQKNDPDTVFFHDFLQPYL